MRALWFRSTGACTDDLSALFGRSLLWLSMNGTSMAPRSMACNSTSTFKELIKVCAVSHTARCLAISSGFVSSSRASSTLNRWPLMLSMFRLDISQSPFDLVEQVDE